MPLAQGPQAVQTAALVVVLQELHEAWGWGQQNGRGWSSKSSPPSPWGVPQRSAPSETLTLVHGEGQELVPELLVHEAIRPEAESNRKRKEFRDSPSLCPMLPPPSPPGPGSQTHHVSMTPDKKVET